MKQNSGVAGVQELQNSEPLFARCDLTEHPLIFENESEYAKRALLYRFCNS
jgi:hypothetical protein